MPDVDASSNLKPPQISDMFQKFAIAFKAKTYEFFADEEVADDCDGFSLLDSTQEVITNQKVVVIKPDRPHNLSPPLQSLPEKLSDDPRMRIPDTIESFTPTGLAQTRAMNPLMTRTIISSIFATISSFEASYFQLQTAHVPFDGEYVKTADRSLISHLQRLSDFKHFCKDSHSNVDFPASSCMEAQVQENQNKLRTLGTISDRLQSEIDQKDSIVLDLRMKLDEIQQFNSNLSAKVSGISRTSSRVLLSIRVFDSLLREACKEAHKFTTILMELMRKAGWDMNLIANSVHPDTEYTKKGDNGYALLSYVCLGMFRGFSSDSFDLDKNVSGNGHVDKVHCNASSLLQLLEHVEGNPVEMLKTNVGCEFSRYCEKKYQELIYPTMESSIFSSLDEKGPILNSWSSISEFYELFVKMASSIWTLHKLAYSFNPSVKIFQVEKGADFSMVFMEDVTKRHVDVGRTRAKVAFTVIPGFEIGRTMIQALVYLCDRKCTEDDEIYRPNV